MRSLPRIRTVACLLLFGILAADTLAQKAKLKLTPEQERELQQAKDLNSRVMKLIGQGKFRDAIPSAKLALQIRERILGDRHPDTATSLNNLGFLLETQGEYAAARPHYERALKIQREVLGEEHRSTATSLNNLGALLNSQGDHTAARPYYEQALKIRKKVLGNEHPDTTQSLNNLGFLLKEQGDYAGARSYCEEALTIRMKVLGEEHPDTANSLNNLGALLKEQGDYAGARVSHEKALKIRKKVLGDAHVDTAESLNNLGSLRRAQGDFAGARSYYEEAFQIWKNALGEEHPRTALSLNNLGHVLQEQGDFAAARRYFEQALRLRKRILGEAHSDTAGSLNNLGTLLWSQGDYAAARPYCEQALAVWKKVHGEEHATTALSLNNLGALLEAQGDYAAARSYYEQALKIRRKILPGNHPDIARSLNNLGVLLSRQKDFAAARSQVEAALSIRREALGDEHPDTALSLNNLGALLNSEGDLVAARTNYEKALEIRRKVVGDEHPDTATSLENLALLEVALGNIDRAAKLMDDARRGIRRHVVRVLPALGLREQSAFLAHKYQAGLHVALNLSLLQSTDSSAAGRSVAWLVNGKAVAQESLVSRTLLTRDLGDPTTAALANELLETRRQLAALTLNSFRPGQEAARRDRISELGAKEDQLTRKLASLGQLPADAGQWIESDRIRASLDPDVVFIDIARFVVFDFRTKDRSRKWQAPHYAAWIMPARAHGNVRIVDLGPADPIDRAVVAVRTSLQAAGLKDGPLAERGEPQVERDVQSKLQAVADLVWKPLSRQLGSARKLVISPDSNLWLLPWAALPVGDSKYLIEDYSLRLVVSGRDLVTKSPEIKTTRPTLFADPAFDLGVAEILGVIKALFPKMALPTVDGTRSLSEKHGLPRVNPLPGTATELQAITPNVEKLTGKKPQVYAGRYALETVVKNVHRPKVLVLSTHGFFLADQETKPDERLAMLGTETRAAPLTVDGKPIENPLLRCGLLLAGCNQRQSAGGDDGVLTGLEICGIDLRGTDLVVLSACETGVGTIRNGEGVAGLRQAFQLAGAKSVVATLWQIPDVESARIMNDFFANLAAGQAKADALRNAQLKRIAARREKYGAAHPYFWAAYTLTGQ